MLQKRGRCYGEILQLSVPIQITSSMNILFALLSSESTITTKKFHFSELPKCIPRFAAFPFSAILLSLLLNLTSAAAGVSYSDHCGSIVRDPHLLPSPNPPLLTPKFPALRHAHVDGSTNNMNKGVSKVPTSLSFSCHKAYRTQKDAVFKIEAVLSLTGVGYSRNLTRRGLRLVHFRPPRIPMTSGAAWNSISFSLSGYWDSISGKLCMVGSGFGTFRSNHVVLKLDYLNSSNIFNSLVNGTLESINVNNEMSLNLNLISIVGVNLMTYKYELIDKEIESNGFQLLDDLTSASLGVADLGQNMCTYIISAGIVDLDYKSDCNNVNCNFLGRGSRNFTPSLMYFNQIECLDDGRVRFLLRFGDVGHNGYRLPFEANQTLVSEGKWDGKNRRLNMVGCRISSDGDEGFVGECMIRLSLRFPARWTLRERSYIVGELWSSRNVNESGYFGRVSLSSIKNKNARATGLGYEYKEIGNARKSCANKMIQKGEGGNYPVPLSPDMRFDMFGSNKKVKDLWGYSSPLYVDNQPYVLSTMVGREAGSTREGKQNLSKMINVCYILTLATSHDFQLNSEYMQIKSFEISAEGTYDLGSAHLCMIACMHVGPPKARIGRNSSLDCEILVDIQYPPLNARNGGALRGTIESTREKSDRLYFEPFEIFSRSVYAGQAKESIWRMDLEITMVLISNSLSCIFIALQLLHVKDMQMHSPWFLS
ncbi:UNVERIFIED_CONTAM: hypothetical protein Sangu_0889600 [Sesamum angustifolium]|uniref:DUF2921 domain-containing protein n=1 Tax=Sesamum angustifolium TaxID=2727405 RepID=A0AAW2PBY3_9LAMI